MRDEEQGSVERAEPGPVGTLVRTLLEIGIDGRGPFSSAAKVADRALASSPDEERAVAKVVRQTLARGAAGGFVTGLGGLITMPVALPANVLEFHLLATRMVAAIAQVRGYDISDPRVRTAVLLALTGADADEILSRAGVALPGGHLAGLAMRQLPRSAIMMINKAIAFRFATSAAKASLTRLGKALPVAGGVIGAGVDTFLMRRIAVHARREFPPVAQAVAEAHERA